MTHRHGPASALGSALLLAVVLGTPGVARAQAADTAIWNDTFDESTGDWNNYGPQSKMSVTTEAVNVHTGKGALEFHYKVGKSDKAPDPTNPAPIDVLVRPTPDGQIAKLKTLRFSARADDDTPLAITLKEKDGGNYITFAWLPKNSWQKFTLTPADFWLTDGPDDPKDPDGKLDMDKVESITVLSVWEFLAMVADNAPIPHHILAPHMGEHTLWLDDFSASEEPPTPSAPDANAPKGVWIDSLRRDIVGWLPLGVAQFRMDKTSPVKGGALRADYTQEEGQLTALTYDLHRFNLAKTDHLAFEVASEKPIKLVVVLEEKGGAKYNAIIDVKGDREVSAQSLAFADFNLADDSPKDADGKLDLDQLKTMTIADLSGITGQSKEKNTLWIGPLRATLANP